MKVGDIILASDSAGNQKYSPVVFIPHKQNNIATLFTHLHTKNRDIKLTSNHVIPAGDCSGKTSLPLLYAHQVRMNTRAHIRLSLLKAYLIHKRTKVESNKCQKINYQYKSHIIYHGMPKISFFFLDTSYSSLSLLLYYISKFQIDNVRLPSEIVFKLLTAWKKLL